MPYYKGTDLGIINICCKSTAIFSQNFTRFLKQINIKFDREALDNMKPTRRAAYNITFFNNKSNISRYFKEDILNLLNEKSRVLKILAVHCVKSVRIRCFSGPYFLEYGLNKDENRE